MSHLKLGCVSFNINLDKLEVVSGTPKIIPINLFSSKLKDFWNYLLTNNDEKSIFIKVETQNYSSGSGYAISNLNSVDLETNAFHLEIVATNNNLQISYTEV